MPVPRFRTPAEYIQARRRERPPIYQRGGGWEALFAGALKCSAPVLSRMAAGGVIASGEIGELTPVAQVTRIGSGYAIEMHSGMMRLIYSAARAITSTDEGKFRGGKSATALNAPAAARHVFELFEDFKTQKIATVQRFPATEDQKGWAHAIALEAETFLLMHELAHIYNERSLWRRLWNSRGGQHAVEVRADATASGWLIDYLLNPKPRGPQRQMFYAGAEFAFRVRMAMETIGMRFAPTHPSAGDRIAALRGRLRQAAGSRTFYAIANTSLAFDQMWRAIECLLLKKPPVFTLALDDVLSSMRTLVQEILDGADINDLIAVKPVRGRAGQFQVTMQIKDPRKAEIVKSAGEYMRSVQPDLGRAARERAVDVFEQGSVEYSLLLSLLKSQCHS